MDGSVLGKYGYVDTNGEVKVIQYGANAMGFQPNGDLPEGIIIQPPVEGNCTEFCDYDYIDDTIGQDPAELTNLKVVNRARTQGGVPAHATNRLPSQNRGTHLDEPITPAPLPRRPDPAAPQSSFQSFHPGLPPQTRPPEPPHCAQPVACMDPQDLVS